MLAGSDNVIVVHGYAEVRCTSTAECTIQMHPTEQLPINPFKVGSLSIDSRYTE